MPDQEFDFVSSAVNKQIKSAVCRIALQLTYNNVRQPIDLFTIPPDRDRQKSVLVSNVHCSYRLCRELYRSLTPKTDTIHVNRINSRRNQMRNLW